MCAVSQNTAKCLFSYILKTVVESKGCEILGMLQLQGASLSPHVWNEQET